MTATLRPGSDVPLKIVNRYASLCLMPRLPVLFMPASSQPGPYANPKLPLHIRTLRWHSVLQ